MPQDKLYRQKALERVSSPDQLNSYIKVSNPSVWFVLIAILILLLTGMYWIFTGTLEISEEAPSITIDGVSYCWLPANKASKLKVGMRARTGDADGVVTEIDDAVSKYDDIEDMLGKTAVRAMGITDEDRLYRITMALEGAANGIGSVSIVKEIMQPITFLIN